MVLMMARQKARPRERRLKTLNKELENNSRKLRDLVKNRHSDSQEMGQLKLSQGKMKNGYDVVDDDDDDAV
jgi:chorismate mutase